MRRLSVAVLCLMLLTGLSTIPTRAALASGPCEADPNGSACLDEIARNPAPDVEPIATDKREVNAYSFFKVLPDTALYDAPGGAVVGGIGDGFTFVIVRAVQGEYAQLRDGHWVKRANLKQTYASNFTGVMLKSMPYPMAWIIQATIPSPAPGASNAPNKANPALKRYTRIFIYATVHVDQWDWYLVGPNQWIDQRKTARVVPVERPADAGEKWVNVNLYEQVLTAYEGSTPIFATLIASGLPDFQTNVGTFKVWARRASTPMSGAMGSPNFYSLPAVPYVMFFDNEISLHGTYWHDGYGYKHSHGCVNMTISDAKWVFNWQGDGDLTVNVTSGK